MRKYLFVAMALLTSVSIMAQNERVPLYLEISYQKPSDLAKAAGVLSLFGSISTSLGTPAPSLYHQVKEVIINSSQSVYRAIVQEDTILPPVTAGSKALGLKAVVTNTMTYAGERQGACATIKAKLYDLGTGKVVKEEDIVYGNKDLFVTLPEAINDLAYKLKKKVQIFLLDAMPLTGTIVQMGVEQDNGKTKETQCYIDLAEQYKVYEKMEMKVYTDDDGKLKEIGELKVKEVQGDELSVCTITKGANKIRQAINKGEKVVVKTVYSKK